MSNNFYNLTFDAVINALEQVGFSPDGHCMALNSYENRVYDIGLEDGSHIVAKFYRPGRWTKEQILEEHKFTFELRDSEIPVCSPILLSENSSIAKFENIYFAVWPRTGGRPADEFSDSDLRMLGRYIGRIHNSGAAHNFTNRLTLNAESYGEKPLLFLLENEFLPLSIEKKYTDTVRELIEIYSSLAEDIPTIRIHGDCHPGNLLKGSEGWFFLDFDDTLTGPAVQDIWMITGGADKYSIQKRDIFLEGYRTFRDFNESWLNLIEPLRALRFIHYAGWLAKRYEDPAFKKAFPHFNTSDYWIQETKDLENQLTLIHNTSYNIPAELQRTEEPQEQALENKDYFWDYEE